MSICPEGHPSDSSDYCDVCGTPMDAPSAGSGSTATPTAATAQAGVECPNCRTENVANALFCEACGYDFTTGTMPRPWVSPFAAASPSVEDESVEDESGEDESGEDESVEDESGEDEPADDEPVTDEPAEEEPAEPEHQSYSAAFLDDGPASSSELFGTSGGYDSPPTETTDELAFEWVAEVWVDPDWYRQQEPPDPMPSPGLPTIVPLRKKSNLIGRPSRSRNIHPDVDCDSDPGASRRQAQLTTDGRRWWIEDLDSANGTYVAGSLAGLPQDPLAVGERHELEPDDRIYLGAWTRMVIRRATDEEIEALS